MFTAASVMISASGWPRHVHDEAVADAPGGADAGVARHHRAHQLVGVKAALHQRLGAAGAHQLHRLGRGIVAVLGVDQFEAPRCRGRLSWRRRGRAPEGRPGSASQGQAWPPRRRSPARPRRRDGTPPWSPADACARSKSAGRTSRAAAQPPSRQRRAYVFPFAVPFLTAHR